MNPSVRRLWGVKRWSHGKKLVKKMSIFLIYHNNWLIRHEVARHGYGLDILVNDDIWQVRYQVALEGYGLEKLINDSHIEIRKIAREKLNEIRN